MRMRKKQWARPELDACAYYIKDPLAMRGKWKECFARGNQPLYLDLGCGKCTFLAELACRNPEINYIGMDISPDVLGVGRRNIENAYEQANRERDNVALLAHNIEDITSLVNENDGVERIYINFCNPWPKSRHHKRRLTHTQQLGKYKKILKPGGEIWFKTDNEDLYLASLRYFTQAGFDIYFKTTDLHSLNDSENIESEHEVMFTAQGITTKAIRARLI